MKSGDIVILREDDIAKLRFVHPDNRCMLAGDIFMIAHVGMEYWALDYYNFWALDVNTNGLRITGDMFTDYSDIGKHIKHFHLSEREQILLLMRMFVPCDTIIIRLHNEN